MKTEGLERTLRAFQDFQPQSVVIAGGVAANQELRRQLRQKLPKDVLLTYASPQFEAALVQSGLSEEQRQSIVNQVMSEGSCQSILELPDEIRNTFVVSADITAVEYIRMQAALQN